AGLQRDERGTETKISVDRAKPRKPSGAPPDGQLTRRRGRGSAGSEGVDAGGEPRQLARDRVLVHDALGRRAMQFGLGELEGRLGHHLVACLYRGLDLLDEGAPPAQPGTVDHRPLFGLAKPFFGGFMMWHAGLLATARAGLYRC